MPNVQIGDNVKIEKAIVGNNAIINHGCNIGDMKKIDVVGAYQYVINEPNLNYKEITGKNKIVNI